MAQIVEERLAASRGAARISISIAVRGSPGLKEIARTRRSIRGGLVGERGEVRSDVAAVAAAVVDVTGGSAALLALPSLLLLLFVGLVQRLP